MDKQKPTSTVTLSFFGGAETVTGANFLFEDKSTKTRILVDCGFFQCRKICDDQNREPFPYDPASIDILFVTHGHIDHIGRIPKLVHDGFRGVIYSTPPTKEIAEAMLADSLGILGKEARRDNLPLIYTKEDVEKTMHLWKAIPYHKAIDIQGRFQADFLDAGHILGSAMVRITRGGRTIIFTGDLGNSPAPLLRDTQEITGAHYLLTESVYGDRNHESVEEREAMLEDIIEETIKKGGALLVPAFSLERTQVLLYEINNLVESGRIPPVPVFLDSPLAIKLTAIYKKNDSYFNKHAHDIIKSGDDIFRFPNLKFTRETEESKAIANIPNPKVIIAGSGMSNGGRIIHHEKRHLPDPASTLLLIGYQAAGSLGRIIQDGAKEVRILGESVPVRARIAGIRGYSAHKDSDGLQKFIRTGADTLEHVYVTMGEPRASLFLAQRVRDYIGVKASVPKKGETVTLDI